jgi:hypothetical protein
MISMPVKRWSPGGDIAGKKHRFCGEDGHECRAYMFRRRCMQDAMDDEILSERALKSSKVEQCYHFAAAFQCTAFGATTLSYVAAGNLLD